MKKQNIQKTIFVLLTFCGQLCNFEKFSPLSSLQNVV